MSAHRLRFVVPVACHKGHASEWVLEVDGLDVRNIGVDPAKACPCPKWGMGEGYTATGPARITQRRVLAHCWIRRREGERIAIKVGNWRDGDIGQPNRAREEFRLLASGCQVIRAYE